jgi:hypothetical protein
MSDNSNLSNFLKPASWAGSHNAGVWEAQNNLPLSGQQSFESADSYATRTAAYNHTVQNQNK